jgi:hypothetical protein
LCAKHAVYPRATKYAGRCAVCLEPIQAGDDVILVLIGEKDNGNPSWAVLHPRSACRPDKEKSVNESAPNGPWAELYLARGAPVEVVKAAYKALAMKYHPDRPGGSVERMQRINAAIGELIK